MDMLHDKWYKVVPCGKRSFAVTEVGNKHPLATNNTKNVDLHQPISSCDSRGQIHTSPGRDVPSLKERWCCFDASEFVCLGKTKTHFWVHCCCKCLSLANERTWFVQTRTLCLQNIWLHFHSPVKCFHVLQTSPESNQLWAVISIVIVSYRTLVDGRKLLQKSRGVVKIDYHWSNMKLVGLFWQNKHWQEVELATRLTAWCYVSSSLMCGSVPVRNFLDPGQFSVTSKS